MVKLIPIKHGQKVELKILANSVLGVQIGQQSVQTAFPDDELDTDEEDRDDELIDEDESMLEDEGEGIGGTNGEVGEADCNDGDNFDGLENPDFDERLLELPDVPPQHRSDMAMRGRPV